MSDSAPHLTHHPRRPSTGPREGRAWGSCLRYVEAILSVHIAILIKEDLEHSERP